MNRGTLSPIVRISPAKTIVTLRQAPHHKSSERTGFRSSWERKALELAAEAKRFQKRLKQGMAKQQPPPSDAYSNRSEAESPPRGGRLADVSIEEGTDLDTIRLYVQHTLLQLFPQIPVQPSQLKVLKQTNQQGKTIETRDALPMYRMPTPKVSDRDEKYLPPLRAQPLSPFREATANNPASTAVYTPQGLPDLLAAIGEKKVLRDEKPIDAEGEVLPQHLRANLAQLHYKRLVPSDAPRSSPIVDSRPKKLLQPMSQRPSQAGKGARLYEKSQRNKVEVRLALERKKEEEEREFMERYAGQFGGGNGGGVRTFGL